MFMIGGWLLDQFTYVVNDLSQTHIQDSSSLLEVQKCATLMIGLVNFVVLSVSLFDKNPYNVVGLCYTHVPNFSSLE